LWCCPFYWTVLFLYLIHREIYRQDRGALMYAKNINCRKGLRLRNIVQPTLVFLGLACILYSALASDAEVFNITRLFVGMLIGITLLLIGAGFKKLQSLFEFLIWPIVIKASRVGTALLLRINHLSLSERFRLGISCPKRRKTLCRPSDIEICIENVFGMGSAATGSCKAVYKKCS
jgi:hypothetical protein